VHQGDAHRAVSLQLSDRPDIGYTRSMRIVVTNDDGIYSPGILAPAKAAEAFARCGTSPPEVEMSSAGHSITSSRPLTYKPTPIYGFEAYRVNGTPADCVALGTHNRERVDVVLVRMRSWISDSAEVKRVDDAACRVRETPRYRRPVVAVQQALPLRTGVRPLVARLK
jgi:Survival protein SurE